MCNVVLEVEWQDYKVNGFPFERCYLGSILIPREFRKRKKTIYKQKTTIGNKKQPSEKEF